MSEIDRAWLAAHPLPEPDRDTDKNKRGRVLAAGGSRAVPGALLLTAEAAFRAGAGKVQLIGPDARALGIAMPEAAVFEAATNRAGELSGAAGRAIAGLLERCDTCVIGPGMGKGAAGGAILDAVLAHPRDDLALVLDAAMIAEAGKRQDALRRWSGRLILTPHPGEMAMLMGCDEKEATQAMAERAAERFDATLVLKRSETWIVHRGEPVLHYRGGGPGLATGGSGDVLAGIVAGLLARGAAPRIAAAWGVWLHGEAGRVLAERIGPIGFLGRELPAEIPALMASVRPNQ